MWLSWLEPSSVSNQLRPALRRQGKHIKSSEQLCRFLRPTHETRLLPFLSGELSTLNPPRSFYTAAIVKTARLNPLQR
jgi:hypothetical protein